MLDGLYGCIIKGKLPTNRRTWHTGSIYVNKPQGKFRIG